MYDSDIQEWFHDGEVLFEPLVPKPKALPYLRTKFKDSGDEMSYKYYRSHGYKTYDEWQDELAQAQQGQNKT